MTPRIKSARYLLEIRRIQPNHFSAWERHEYGETAEEIAPRYNRHWRTIYRWIERVNDAIDVERGRRLRHGHTVASGRKTRRVGDPTPQGRLPGGSFPSPAGIEGSKHRPR